VGAIDLDEEQARRACSTCNGEHPIRIQELATTRHGDPAHVPFSDELGCGDDLPATHRAGLMKEHAHVSDGEMVLERWHIA
jgi:hypothetical protein